MLSNASNQSTAKERVTNLRFLKYLFTLYFLELLVAFVWSSFLVSYPSVFSWVTRFWYLPLICLIIAAGVLAFTMASNKSAEMPISAAIYAIFTLTFAFGIGWLCLLDTSLLLYFSLTTLTAIAFGLMLYAVYGILTQV